MSEKLDPAAMSISAPFVNLFQVVIVGDNVRVAFGEGFPGESRNYRSAITMSLRDARALSETLHEQTP